MVTLLPFILVKELHTTQIHITLFISLKPALALGSFYWGALACTRKTDIIGKIIWINIVGKAPLLMFPLIQNTWFYIAAVAIAVLADRALIPPWMELLKNQLPTTQQNKTVSDGSLIRFVLPILCTITLSSWMDHQKIYHLLFAITGLLSIASILPLVKCHIHQESKTSIQRKSPWKESLTVIKTQKDFRLWQGIFFLGGVGIMMYQPLLPKYCASCLNMNYTQISLAISVCKGIGFALTSRIWNNFISRESLFKLSALVALTAAITPLLVSLSSNAIWLFYLAFTIYGTMQAGSEPIWHLSGPLFANQNNSGPYTSTNILLVGIRGLFAPILGSLIATSLGIKPALAICSAICLTGAAYGIVGHKLLGKNQQTQPNLRKTEG